MATNIKHGCITVITTQDGRIVATTLNIEILNVALGKEMTFIGLRVTKAVIDSVSKRAQNRNQLEGYQLENIVFDN